jgi:hypothetical protein
MDTGSGSTEGTESALRATPAGFLARGDALVCQTCAAVVPDDENLSQVHRSWHERVG